MLGHAAHPKGALRSVSILSMLAEKVRDGGTTMKKNWLFEGRGLGGREENRPKRCVFFVGNAMTIKY